MSEELQVLGDVFNIKSYVGKDCGLEIETESDTLYDIPSNLKFFKAIRDGSLRGNMPIEFVLKQPVSIKDKELHSVLTYLKQFVKDKGIKWKKDSISTSTHVHMNASDKSLTTIGSFITTWILLETLLLRYSGPTRLSNFFCLPFKDAKSNLDTAKNVFKYFKSKRYKDAQSYLLNSDIKYAALNLKSLGHLGTLEARCFRGETNLNLVEEWCNILHTIMEYSKNKTPTDILGNDYRNARENFPILVLGDDYGNKLLKESPDVKKDLGENLMMAAQFSTVIPNWNTLGLIPKPKKIPRSYYTKDLETTASSLFNKNYGDLTWSERLVVEDILEKKLNSKYTKFKIVDPEGDV